jgi:hypothetical protein
VVVNEKTGARAEWASGIVSARDTDDSQDGRFHAARAYFAAHPQPKPWHAAKPGEVWELTFDGISARFAATVAVGAKVGEYTRFVAMTNWDAPTFPANSEQISEGVMVFPESPDV